MKRIGFFLLMLVFISSSYRSIAQAYSVENVVAPPRIFNSAILPDYEGGMLFGTWEGVFRYDGTDTFAPFLNKSNGLKGDTVVAILSDRSNALWIQTDKGVSVKSATGWTYYLNAESYYYSLPSQKNSPDIWLAKIFRDWSSQPSLTRFSGSTSFTYTNVWFSEITAGPDGQYYARGREFFKLQGREWISEQEHTGIKPGEGYSVAVDAQNTVYLGTANAYYRRDAGEIDFDRMEINTSYITDMQSDHLGRVFMLSDAVFMLENGQVISLDVPPPINAWYTGITVGKDGTVYLTSRKYEDFVYTNMITKVKFASNETQFVKGKLFNDLNADGIQGIDEPGVANHIIKRTPGDVYAITNVDGFFSMPVISGGYNIAWQPRPFWQAGGTPTAIDFEYPQQANEIFYIGIQSHDIHDVSLSINGGATRPGFFTQYQIDVFNQGNTIETPVVTMQYDSDLEFQSSEPSPLSHVGNTLTWHLSVKSQKQERVSLKFLTPVGTVFGTEIFNLATVDAVADEDDLLDNGDSLLQVVTGSYDPNDKLVREGVLPEKYVKIGSPLTYTIRFQNTGTDTAFTVRIQDMIDPHFDVATLEVISSSHPMETYLERRRVTFLFKDILLPDSTRNEPGSHGFVKFHINPKEGIVDGTDVKNSAEIYFDFNEAVVTNTVSNRYVFNVPDGRVLGIESEKVDVRTLFYPNPSCGIISINPEHIGKFLSAKLISTAGRIEGEYNIVNGRIDLENALPGFYLLKLEGRGHPAVAKIIVVR